MKLRKIPDRMVVYARDVVNITGRSLRFAQRLLKEIREFYGKGKKGFVTIKEFCSFCKFTIEDVLQYIQG